MVTTPKKFSCDAQLSARIVADAVISAADLDLGASK